MDSPRGRIYQMVQVAEGAPITDSYREHIDLCLACRGCERRVLRACSMGGWWKRRAPISSNGRRVRWLARIARKFVFDYLLPSRTLLRLAGTGLWIYQRSGMQWLVRSSGILGRAQRYGIAGAAS